MPVSSGEWKELRELVKQAKIAAESVQPFSEGGYYEPAYQLGEVSYHLTRAAVATNPGETKEQLEFSRRHCGRAIYDSYDFGIHIQLKWLATFQNDYARFQHKIGDHVSNYLKILERAEVSLQLTISARETPETAKSLNKDPESPPLKLDRYKLWTEAKDCFNDLCRDGIILRASRTVLDDAVRERRNKIFLAVIVAMVPLLAFLFGLYKYFSVD